MINKKTIDHIKFWISKIELYICKRYLQKMKQILYLLSLFFIASCAVFEKNPQKGSLNYMQNIDSIATQASVNQTLSTIQHGDQLMILVSAKDLDVVKPFNQNYSSGQLIQESVSGGNVRQEPIVSGGPTYVVDSNGNIDFPVLGQLNTTGKTLEEFKESLRRNLTKYIKEPTVTVRNINYKVTVLGEVNKPGQYIISDGNATVLNALGLAGDLTMYGTRNDVLMVRNIDGTTTKQRIDLNNAEFLNSPFYHLKQGDVIYVSANPTKEKTSRLNPNTGLYISIASIAITIIALIIRK